MNGAFGRYLDMGLVRLIAAEFSLLRKPDESGVADQPGDESPGGGPGSATFFRHPLDARALHGVMGVVYSREALGLGEVRIYVLADV